MNIPENDAQTKQDVSLLGAVYHSVSMGAGAYEHMLKVAKDPSIKDCFTRAMMDHRSIEAATLGRLHRLHESPEDVGTMTKLMSRAGVRLNTAMDASASGLAKIATQSAATGISELRSAIEAAPEASQEAKHIAQAYIDMERNIIEDMGNY